MLDEVIAHNAVGVEEPKEDVVVAETAEAPKKYCC